MHKLITFIVLSCIINLSIYAQLTPYEALEQMGRGINLGNTLEPPTEGEWNNPKAEEWYFDAYLEAGFKTVRVPVRWDKHTESVSPYKIDETFLNRVEEVVDWGLSRNLYIIINAHHETWLKDNYELPENQARFDSIWSQISTHFEGKSEKLFFEIFNEPNGLTRPETDEVNERILNIIRKKHPTRIVIYSGNGWSAAADMKAAKIPNDDYLMATYHSYDPWSFAGEGEGTWGTDSDMKTLDDAFADIQSWSNQNNVPVLIGEYGAVRDCDYNSRMKHYAKYIEGCLAHNVANTVWDDGGMFGILDRKNRSWDDPKDIIVHTSLQSPTEVSVAIKNDTLVSLNWKLRSTDHDSLFIERKTKGGKFERYHNLGNTQEQFTDSLIEEENYYYYRIIASYADQNKKAMYSYPIRVFIPPWERSPFSGNPFDIPGTIEAEDYDIGGELLTFHETTETNIPGAYRPNEAVDIESRDDGGFHIAYIEEGEWLEYTINVLQTKKYKLEIPVASLEGGGRFKTKIYGVSTYFDVPKTNSWQSTSNISKEVFLREGEYTMRVQILETPSFNIDKFIFSEIANSDTKNAPSIELFPNPANDALYIHGIDQSDSGRILIYSIDGNLCIHTSLISEKINISELSNGIYSLILETDSAIISRKFVKQ